MGNTFSFTDPFQQLLSKPRHINYIIVGLPSAGKTTILKKIFSSDLNTTTPISGLTIKEFEYKNMTFRAWDLFGSDEVRHHWKQYLKDASGILFVVDSGDVDRISSAKDELYRFIEDPDLYEKPLLVYANKQDLGHALSTKEVAERIRFQDIRNRQWFIQAASAITGDGLEEGMDWISRETYS